LHNLVGECGNSVSPTKHGAKLGRTTMYLTTFLFAVLLLELTPGPNMAYLATLALGRGRAAGLIATAGVAVGLAVHALVAGLGAGVLIQEYQILYDVLRWIGVGYLLYLAWEGWHPEKENSPGRADLVILAGPLFLRGFLSNIFNPKSILFFVSVLPTFLRTGPGAPAVSIQMVVFGILYVAVATAVHGLIVVLAAQLRPGLVEGPRQMIVRRTLSVLLAFIAIWLAWSTRR
jgi:threonine/homoserine/homoserine lactone efflux protein